MAESVKLKEYLWLIHLYESSIERGTYSDFEKVLGYKFANGYLRGFLKKLNQKEILVKGQIKEVKGNYYTEYLLDKNRLMDLFICLYLTKKTAQMLDHKYAIFSTKDIFKFRVNDFDINEGTIYGL